MKKREGPSLRCGECRSRTALRLDGSGYICVDCQAERERQQAASFPPRADGYRWHTGKGWRRK